MKRKSIVLAFLLCAAMLIPNVQADAKKISSTSAAAKKARSLIKGAVVTEVDKDKENGVTVYEVNLVKGKKKYEVKYRASDGTQLSYEWERIGYIPSGKKRVSKTKIKKLALKEVPKATITKISLDVSDGEYDVDLKKGTKKYSLEYDAYKGTLISYKWKLINSKSNSSSTNALIGMEKAKSIAKKKVPAGAEFTKVELDKEDGRYVYEIEMRKGHVEYDITIDAKTGAILEYDTDYDDD